MFNIWKIYIKHVVTRLSKLAYASVFFYESRLNGKSVSPVFILQKRRGTAVRQN